MEKVLAARFYEAKKPIRLDRIDVPPVGDDDVLVEVKATGICGSELHVIDGRTAPGLPPPITLGHEAAGIIEAKGKNVANVNIGDRVGIDYVQSCGKCRYCLSGRDNLCDNFTVMSFNTDGSWKEKVVVPMRHVHKLPNNLAFPEGSIMNCSVMTAYHAAKLGPVFAGSTVLVYGLGGVGMSLLQWTKLFGATEIIAVDLEDGKLDFAKRRGATITLNPREGNIVKRITEASGGGVDIGFEVIGRVEPERNVLKSVRKGGKAIMVGMCWDPMPVSVVDDLQVPEVTLQSPQDHLKTEIPQVLKFIETGKYDSSGMVTHKLPLSEVNEGLRILSERVGNPGRVVLEP